jgi:hypothetical protein
MGRRVIRPTPDYDWKRGIELTAYRIEWPDGTPTGTGLFASPEWAKKYAVKRGWPVTTEREEECA